jgi:hypothetical protein
VTKRWSSARVPEHVAVGDERVGVFALTPGELHEDVPEPVDHLDRLTLLIDALRAACPARHHRSRTPDLAVDGELLADHRQQPFRDPV